MARRSSVRNLSKHSILDLVTELKSRQSEVGDLHARRDELVAEIEQIDSVIAAMGGVTGPSIGGARKAGRGTGRLAKAVGKTGGRKLPRGQGWATIEVAINASGGNGTTASLKEPWAKLGGKTPLSFALASFVKSGKLKRKGEGRRTVYNLNV